MLRLQHYSRKIGWNKIIAHGLLLLFSLACLIPLWVIIVASFTDDVALTKYGFGLFPSQFSLDAYRYIFQDPRVLLRAYAVTLFVSGTGTASAVLMMALIAYPLSRQEFALRKWVAFLVYFTMLFSGGLVPYYLLMTNYLQLRDSLLALILPGMVSPFIILILRTYFAQLPVDLIDAARIDGAGEGHIFFRLILPLAKPALGTVSVLVFIGYWNDYFGTLLFIRNRDLYSLQYLLFEILNRATAIAVNPTLSTTVGLPAQSLRMAMVVLATGPAAIVFLFFQKYLVRGITLGSLK